MKKEVMVLWKQTPGMCQEIPQLTAYIPKLKKSDGAIVIFPGGGYGGRAEQEGEMYAEFFAENGITAFLCAYRVAPHRFPLPLLDARRAIRIVRFNAKKYGIDKNKVYVIGSSAGGHLAALVSTYNKPLEYEGIDEIDSESARPDGQILCYPVIKLWGHEAAHIGSARNFLGDRLKELGEQLSPDTIADSETPRAFIWHTFTDRTVSVINSLDYVKRLKQQNVPAEVHIYPEGEHGLGLAQGLPYVSSWRNRLLEWLRYNKFMYEE